MTEKKSNKKKKETEFCGEKTICAACGKEFLESDYGAMCRVIMNHKPVCSFECNVKLGQVKHKGK